MNILDLLQSDGIQAWHVGRGEFHSPCPFCQGRDRFSSWPERRNSNGKYGGGRGCCRNCNWNGDGINYLQKRKGLSFRDACKALEIEPGQMLERSASRAWQPAAPKDAPGAAWQAQAKAFMDHCTEQLQRGSGALTWLQAERGLNAGTISRAGLGWNNQDKYESRKSWGMAPEVNSKGKVKMVWLAAGLIIPLTDNQGQVTRIRIRRKVTDSYGRYVNVTGSGMAPMVQWTDQPAVAVVESELDALLIMQECGEIIGTIAMGSAQSKPDADLHKRLMEAGTVLCCLDSDEAGQRAAWGHWRIYPGFRRWPVIRGKDATEQWRAGIPVKLDRKSVV